MINNEFTILGAGIQGICIALELAKQGKEVIILDQDTTPFNRASLRNEGKIHLGIVYINDLSFETPKLMLKAALQFRKSLERWIGQDSYNLGLSNPFHYLVAKDSFLNTDEIKKRYAILENHFKEYKSNHPNWDYLGTKPEALTKQIPNRNVEALFGNQTVQGAFETPELSIDTAQLCKLLTAAIAQNPLITFLPGYRITHLQREGENLKILGNKEGSSFSLLSKRVINATWEGKYSLDASLGIPKPQNLLHRIKYRVMVKLDSNLLNRPSATMVIGKFGDVVIRKDGTAYLSWYPTGCTDWSSELLPPSSWENPSKGIVSKEIAKKLSTDYINEIEKWFPGMVKSKPYLVDAGVIVAYGNTDVDDRASKLHDRSNIGLKTYGGNYYSIDTGKLTTAPYFAVESVKSILSTTRPKSLEVS